MLGDPELRALLDFSLRVAIIASAILHHLTDDEDPLGVIGTFKDALPEGSCLFVSHFRTLGDPESAELEAVLHEAFGRGTWRTDAQIAGTSRARTSSSLASCRAPSGTRRPIRRLTGYQRLIVAGLGRTLSVASRGTCASPSPGGPS